MSLTCLKCIQLDTDEKVILSLNNMEVKHSNDVMRMSEVVPEFMNESKCEQLIQHLLITIV